MLLSEFQKALISPQAQQFLQQLLQPNVSFQLHSSLSGCWNYLFDAIGVERAFSSLALQKCLENLDLALVCVTLGAKDYASGKLIFYFFSFFHFFYFVLL
jgi:hypothetical protein